MWDCHGFAVKKEFLVWECLGTTDKSINLYYALNSVKFYKSCFYNVAMILFWCFLNIEV